jgi:hypothetical protein
MVCSTLSLHEVIFRYISWRFLLPDSLPDDGVDDDSLASGSLLGLPVQLWPSPKEQPALPCKPDKLEADKRMS